jgi:hypothetical protein
VHWAGFWPEAMACWPGRVAESAWPSSFRWLLASRATLCSGGGGGDTGEARGVRLRRWGDGVLTEVAGRCEVAKVAIDDESWRHQADLVDGGNIQVDLQHGKGAGEVRRGPISNEGEWGWELTERGGSVVAAASIPVVSERLRRPASDKKSREVRWCSRCEKGRRGGGGKERAAMALDTFKAARRGSWGGGGGPVRGGATRLEGAGGARPDRQEVAGNGPAAVRTGDALVGGARTGEDGALTRGPDHCAGF